MILTVSVPQMEGITSYYRVGYFLSHVVHAEVRHHFNNMKALCDTQHPLQTNVMCHH